MTLLLDVLFVTLMVLVAYCDVRYMKIPNALPLAAMALFGFTCFTLPYDEVVWRLAAAGIVFVLTFVLFSLRLIGGGDTKMLPALILFVPTAGLISFSYIFSAAMLFGSLLTIAMQRIPALQDTSLLSVAQKGHFPMGISIAMAGIGQLVLLG